MSHHEKKPNWQVWFWLVLGASLALAATERSSRADEKKDTLSDKNPVRVTLISNVEQAALNQELQLGVRLEMAPHWHIYWTSPGNTGTPTRVHYRYDKKYVSVERARFPVPEVFDAKEMEFLSFGYGKAVLIPASAMVAEPPPTGSTEVFATATWLACKKSCVTGKASLKLTLAVASQARPSRWAKLFSETASKLPEPADTERAWLESMTYKGGKFQAQIRLAGLKTATSFIPSLPAGGICSISGYGIKKHHKGKGYVAHLTFSGDNCFPGLGGLVLGQARDAPDGTAPRAFLVEASPPDSEATPETSPAPAPAVKKAPPAAAGKTTPAKAGPAVERASLWLMLLYAFLGGLLLNVMPCVIPVVVPKMLSVVRTAQKAEAGERRRVLWSNGLAYTAGVVATMLSLGVTVVVRKLVYTNAEFSGAEACELGFATETSDEPLARAMALAEEIAGKNPQAIQAAKRLSNALADSTDEALLLSESAEQTQIIGKANQMEAVMAFMEKRAPEFS